MFRGVKNIRDIGKIIDVNDESELETWDEGNCNTINGTDGLIFSPFREPEQPLAIYDGMACRTFYVPYVKKTSYRGISVGKYAFDFGDIANEEENRCFCREEDECPPKGTMDLFPCIQAAISASLPHFLHADPKLLENMEGLSPDEDKHELFIKVEMVKIARFSFKKKLMF